MGVDTIYALGDDQMTAHWNLIFPNGIPTGGSTEEMVMRITDFDPPEQSIERYEVSYHGLTIEKTGSPSESKEFTLTIRLKKDWSIYTNMKRWANGGADPETGARMADDDLRTTVILQPIDIDENGEEVPTRDPITYKRCKLVGLKLSTFDHTNKTDPMTYTATFIYVSQKDKPY